MLKASQAAETATLSEKGIQAVPDTTSREQLQVKVWADAAGRQEGQELHLIQELWPGLS